MWIILLSIKFLHGNDGFLIHYSDLTLYWRKIQGGESVDCKKGLTCEYAKMLSSYLSNSMLVSPTG